jgi:hypothetical protein
MAETTPGLDTATERKESSELTELREIVAQAITRRQVLAVNLTGGRFLSSEERAELERDRAEKLGPRQVWEDLAVVAPIYLKHLLSVLATGKPYSTGPDGMPEIEVAKQTYNLFLVGPRIRRAQQFLAHEQLRILLTDRVVNEDEIATSQKLDGGTVTDVVHKAVFANLDTGRHLEGAGNYLMVTFENIGDLVADTEVGQAVTGRLAEIVSALTPRLESLRLTTRGVDVTAEHLSGLEEISFYSPQREAGKISPIESLHRLIDHIKRTITIK